MPAPDDGRAAAQAGAAIAAALGHTTGPAGSRLRNRQAPTDPRPPTLHSRLPPIPALSSFGRSSYRARGGPKTND